MREQQQSLSLPRVRLVRMPSTVRVSERERSLIHETLDQHKTSSDCPSRPSTYRLCIRERERETLFTYHLQRAGQREEVLLRKRKRQNGGKHGENYDMFFIGENYAQ